MPGLLTAVSQPAGRQRTRVSSTATRWTLTCRNGPSRDGQASCMRLRIAMCTTHQPGDCSARFRLIVSKPSEDSTIESTEDNPGARVGDQPGQPPRLHAPAVRVTSGPARLGPSRKAARILPRCSPASFLNRASTTARARRLGASPDPRTRQLSCTGREQRRNSLTISGERTRLVPMRGA